MTEQTKWLLLEVVNAMHEAQLAEHGGLGGSRDEGALVESALARPENHFDYGESDTFVLAATYADGIIKNHPFADGNKRTGFLTAFTFLYLNGYHLQAPEADAVVMTQDLAAGKIEEDIFAKWLRDHSVPTS